MATVSSYAPGTPSWVDLGTPDPAASSAFYSALFGWQIDEGPPEAGGYRMCLLRGVPVAGMGPQQNPEMPPWWTTYFSVTSADDTAVAIIAAGGTIVVPPMDVLDVGRMAVAMDPGGAVFSVWEPRSHIGSGLMNEHGTFCWNELTTRAVDESIAFYEAVFGWQPVRTPDYVELLRSDGQHTIGGLMPMTGDGWPPEVPNHWTVYFAVDDTDAALAQVHELGGTMLVPPFDIPAVGRAAVVRDPQGAIFTLIALAPGQSAPVG